MDINVIQLVNTGSPLLDAVIDWSFTFFTVMLLAGLAPALCIKLISRS